MRWDKDLLIAVITVTATVAAASPGWWPALVAAGRPERLRRDEAVWRQILELGDAQEVRDDQVRVLHRHTAAQLISLRLIPLGTVRQTVRLGGLLVGGVAAVLAGVLGLEFLDVANPWWWGMVGLLLVVAAASLGLVLLDLADTTNARNGITRDLLDGIPVPPVAVKDGLERLRRYRREPLRYWWARMVALGAGTALSAGGVTVMFSTAPVSQAALDVPSALGMVTGFAVYVLGLIPARVAWAGLVQRLPEVPILDHAGRTAPTREYTWSWATSVATAYLLGRWQAGRTRDGEESP